MEHIDIALVDWSRAQFALTALYHWLFVPLTLGITFIIAIMESIYVKTGNPQWKKITKFWMTLFGVNFAIGVATGLILEFEFGTNWSNYSWFVGDIFGAPLAVEGIMAFFMESTFIAIMFFGWNKVSKKVHLISTWLVAFGSNLSALWILVANGWMQFPTGMKFNPDTARNEMVNFWDVLFSPVAINKFLHTITSGYVLASAFVIGVSCWFLLKNRDVIIAKKSIVIAAVFGLISVLFLTLTGDGSAYEVAQKQPMKLAAMEGLYQGQEGAGLIAAAVLTPGKELKDEQDPFIFKVEIPKLLSLLGERDANAFIPGIKDLVYGNEKYNILSAEEKIKQGRVAIKALAAYKNAKKEGDHAKAAESLKTLEANFQYFGYGYLNSPEDIIPNIPITFYSFHIMVMLGGYFIVFFALILFLILKDKLDKIKQSKLIYKLAIITVPLTYIATMAGWITAEVGRQPWTIQDLLPTVAAVSRIDANAVIITFVLFSITFTALLIAELKIMFTQIKKGPDGHAGKEKLTK